MSEADAVTWRSLEVEEGTTRTVEEWLGARSNDGAGCHDAVRALLAENARLRSVLGHCPKGIAVLDERGHVRGYNRELVELLGEAPALGASIAHHFEETDRELLHEVVARAGTTRRAAAVLKTRVHDGSPREIEFFAATLPSGSSKSIGVVLAGDDRTADIDRESQRRAVFEADRRSAYALGGVALHEDVEPFRRKALDALESQRVDGPTSAAIGAAIEALRDLGRVLERRAGRERLSGNPGASCDVREIAERVARVSWVGAARRRVTIQVAIDRPIRVAASAADLTQILANFVDNAVDAIEQEGRFGFIVLSAAPLDQGRVQITVRDDGPGVDPSRLQRSLSERESAEDGGLGVAIARVLVSSLRGAIRALSEPGRGTTIAIELPAA